jgi:hypothetical protein
MPADTPGSRKGRVVGSGPRWQAPFAHYDRGSCSWRTSEPSLFGESIESQPIWPTSGMWDLGRVYELPTSALLTAVNGGSLLPTPQARDHKGRNQRDDETCLPGAVDRLLPTPVASDSEGSRRATARTDEWTSHEGTTLADAVRLLPTPAAWDGDRGPDYARQRDRQEMGPGGDDLVTTLARLWRGETTDPPSPDGND